MKTGISNRKGSIMRIKELLSLLLLLISISSLASPINETEAKRRAQSFFLSTSRETRSSSSKDNLRLISVGPNSEIGSPLYYIFSRPIIGGFVIVSGDDALTDIIGYSEKGTVSNMEMPENLKWYLSEYSSILQYARNNNINLKGRVNDSKKHDIDTLVTCLWDQGAPYNNLCPIGSSGKHCYTGCVATAMAQVMYYHKWPETGHGNNTYNVTPDGNENLTQTLSSDFSKTHFDWGNMIDSYKGGIGTESSKDAVAQLMLNVGIALEMAYGTSSSSPTQMMEAQVLKKYFRYSYKTTNLQHVNDSAFTEIVYNELEQGRPVLVGGTNSNGTGGHLFVCDGYKNDGTFHFNWGWNGAYNGYYSTLALVPIQGYDFTYDHRLIYNIEPYRGEIPDGTVEIDNSIAGNLETNIPEEAYYATSLKISGDINGTDMMTLRRLTGRDENKNATGGIVTSLDLSDAKFVPGGDIYCEDYTITSSDEVPNHGFYWSNLEKVILPKSVSTIGKNSFEMCQRLTDVTIGNNIKRIEFCAFNVCSALKKIELPSSVDFVASYTFWNDDNLDSVIVLANQPPTAYGKSFSDACYSNAKLIVPNGTKAAYSSAEGWKNFANIIESESTGISAISIKKKTSNVYNIQGQLVREGFDWKSSLAPGVYIINNKKVIIK